jgi:hypothetical protein
MIQVQLDRKPYAKHTFYRGTYTYNNQKFEFTVTEEWSENCLQPALILEFELEYRLLPFCYNEAREKILKLYLPQNENNN